MTKPNQNKNDFNVVGYRTEVVKGSSAAEADGNLVAESRVDSRRTEVSTINRDRQCCQRC